ncbi:MAG: TIGR03986 family CRISPR-associated RAMP protein [Sulfurimonas sp.]|nr:TIGR03986 family CRISPR-associated RAMP protein [Sulfurimonas sp.]
MITAPFNFVPLNEKVFFPSWSEDVSHDVPFEDGESGVLDITITAKSPIFIRDHEDEEKFCNHNGEYYIPSTSVKGMVRNVLEIMSFAKLGEELFTDNTYAVRDLSNRDLYMSKIQPANMHCGWLLKDGDDYIINDCGRPGRIKHEEIDKIFNIDFASKFKKGEFGNKAENKTALKKYELIQSNNFTYNFKHTTTSTVGDKRYEENKSSSLQGTIVLTGQPSGRDEGKKIPSGKVYEFIFFEPKENIKLNKKVMDNFLFAYFDKRTTQPLESADWKYWKEKLHNGEKVPVFFQKKGREIAHFGLSYLYKLPYEYSIKDGIAPIHFNEGKLDLAQTIFGYANKNSALKGRVQFSHFKAISNIKELNTRTEILGTPRASYYPIYVKQNAGTYITMMNQGFEIAGRKRYPIHKSNTPVKRGIEENDNIGTSFSPLKEGVVFQGKLRYHNLKKEELGAILSSLTFHNTKGTFHNIGLAKSLGYGKIKVTVENIEEKISSVKKFEIAMMQVINDWSQSPQIMELVTMASEQNNSGNSSLKYMELPEFSKAKTSREFLKSYTSLLNITKTSVESLVSQSDLEEIEKQKEVLLAKEIEDEKRRVFQKELKEVTESKNIQKMESFIEKYKDLKELKELKESLVNKQENDKFTKVNEIAKNAWEAIHNPKYKAKLKKSLESFIKKWEAKKNNKGSETILEYVEKAKLELHKGV